MVQAKLVCRPIHRLHLRNRSLLTQRDRSSGLPLMQVFCVVDNEAPGFAPLPLPLAWVTPKCRLIYCKILLFKKKCLNIFFKKKEALTGIETVVFRSIVERLTWCSHWDSTLRVVGFTIIKKTNDLTQLDGCFDAFYFWQRSVWFLKCRICSICARTVVSYCPYYVTRCHNVIVRADRFVYQWIVTAVGL